MCQCVFVGGRCLIGQRAVYLITPSVPWNGESPTLLPLEVFARQGNNLYFTILFSASVATHFEAPASEKSFLPPLADLQVPGLIISTVISAAAAAPPRCNCTFKHYNQLFHCIRSFVSQTASLPSLRFTSSSRGRLHRIVKICFLRASKKEDILLTRSVCQMCRPWCHPIRSNWGLTHTHVYTRSHSLKGHVVSVLLGY